MRGFKGRKRTEKGEVIKEKSESGRRRMRIIRTIGGLRNLARSGTGRGNSWLRLQGNAANNLAKVAKALDRFAHQAAGR
jgi:hypothetical protein